MTKRNEPDPKNLIKKPRRIRCLTSLIEHQKKLEKSSLAELNLFDIEHSSILSWYGTGSPGDHRDPKAQGSFCHIVVAHEISMNTPWLLFIDQEAPGKAIANSIEWLIPRTCKLFDLDVFNIRAFEIDPGDNKLFCEEVDLKRLYFQHAILKADIAWKPCNASVLGSLEKIISVADDNVIDVTTGIFVGPAE